MTDPDRNYLNIINPARKTIFGQEPAFWTMAIQAALVLLVSFGLNLSDTQTGAIIIAVNAVMGVALAVLVRPINIAVFSTLIQAALTFVTAFGLAFTPQQIGALTAFAGVVFSLIAIRPQVVPLATLKLGNTSVQPNLPPGV